MTRPEHEGVAVWRFIDGAGFNRFLARDQYVQPNDDPFIAFPEAEARALVDVTEAALVISASAGSYEGDDLRRLISALDRLDAARRQTA